MPFRKIPSEIKIAAICLFEDNILPLPAILDYLNFSRRTFYCVLDLWHTTGDVVQHTNGVKGRCHILHYLDINYLRRLIRHRPNWFLNELLYLLETNRFISVHYTTIHWELVRAGLSSKKIKKIASEQNENLQADYIGRIAQYSLEQLGFLDEVSKDERSSFRAHGQSWKGLGLLTIDGMISDTVVEGSMTHAMFLEYLEGSVACFSLFWVLLC
ncbi:hypothetical protein BYT27DRAFT_7084722 [Phlegmacium glaucopus]|nr:hypothetical protein BYT27DRAFT_7084722 [Phlegmacium glaucopus]